MQAELGGRGGAPRAAESHLFHNAARGSPMGGPGRASIEGLQADGRRRASSTRKGAGLARHGGGVVLHTGSQALPHTGRPTLFANCRVVRHVEMKTKTLCLLCG
ncbi:hypothetical protein NDU88_002663 [Pleurodeles waltl]|uniref:Uncharacterized protein n=1 Tax=Pleurodeles waltl TaxID=8319 RepID=A0AAV7NEE6_PLEWA|nr:hypothetical protein NDU88_002663 [Pleurodeles waltl]